MPPKKKRITPTLIGPSWLNHQEGKKEIAPR